MKYLFLLLAMVSQFAVAQDEGSTVPEFVLGEIGVQINLEKKSWTMNRWSDWDFKATNKDSVLIYAWSTPFQMDVVEGDLEGWAQVHTEKAKEEGSIETNVLGTSMGTIQEIPCAMIQVEMKVEGGTLLAMRGVTLPVQGKMLHMAVISSTDRIGKAQKALDKATAELEIKKLAAELVWGGDVNAEVSSVKLGEQWRVPLKTELPNVMKMSKALTVPSFMGCWAAIHPVAGTTPDVMVTCQDKQVLGIVDSFTFPDVQSELKTSWFGTKATVTSESLEMNDGRMGVSFASSIGGQNIHILGVANNNGIAKTIVAGSGKGGLDLGAEIRNVVQASVIAAPEPMEFRDVGIYYITYRPFHPFVLGPVILAFVVFCLIIALIVVGARRQPTYDDF